MNGNKLTENKDDIQVLKYGVKLLWDLSNAFNTYKMLTKHALRHWPGFSDMPYSLQLQPARIDILLMPEGSWPEHSSVNMQRLDLV